MDLSRSRWGTALDALAAAVLAAAAGALLSGCPQTGVGTDASSAGSSGSVSAGSSTGGGNGGTQTVASSAAANSGTTAGSGTGSTGTATGSASSSAGTTACGGSKTPGPSLSCTSTLSGALVVAGQTVEIDCAVSATNVGWTTAASLNGAVIQNRLSTSPPTLYVTYPGSALPVNFADAAVSVSVSATDCDQASVATTVTVSFSLVGNMLASNYSSGTVDAYTSDGQFRGNFLGPGILTHPGLVAKLSDGSFLAGGEPDSAHPGLVHLDGNGNVLSGWDAKDHANNPLWSSNTVPFAAAQDASGTVWVTASYYGGTNGLIHRFSLAGSYQNDAPLPTDEPSTSGVFNAQGIGALPNGDMVVADAALNSPYLVRFPSGGGTPSHVPLSFEICQDEGTATPVACHSDSNYPFGEVNAVQAYSGGSILVTIDNGDEGMIGLFDSSLRFVLATAQDSTSMVDRGYYNTLFSALAVSGNVIVASPGTTGCLLNVSERTLFDPMPDATEATCWSQGDGDVGARGLVHLGP